MKKDVEGMSLTELKNEKLDLDSKLYQYDGNLWEYNDADLERFEKIDDAILRHNNLTCNYPPTANVDILSINDLLEGD